MPSFACSHCTDITTPLFHRLFQKTRVLTSNNQHRSSLYLSLVFLGECEHLPCQPPVLYCPPSSLCTRFARAHAIAATVWRRAPLNHCVLPCLLAKNLTITRLRAHWPRSRRPIPPLRRRSKVPRRMLGPVATHRVDWQGFMECKAHPLGATPLQRIADPRNLLDLFVFAATNDFAQIAPHTGSRRAPQYG